MCIINLKYSFSGRRRFRRQRGVCDEFVNFKIQFVGERLRLYCVSKKKIVYETSFDKVIICMRELASTQILEKVIIYCKYVGVSILLKLFILIFSSRFML
jgi:hypothetical protein